MKCKNCGYKLEIDWSICPKCFVSCQERGNEAEDGHKTSSNSSEDPAGENGDIAGEAYENIQETETQNAGAKRDISSSSGNEKLLIIIFLVCLVLSFTIWQVRGIAFIAALITIVTAFIKYPGSRAIKVLFWVFLGLIGLGVIVLIILAIACANMASSCFSSCR